MVTKVRELTREEQTKPTETHVHYWLIEGARGPTSRGICKYCGVTQEFRNSFFNVMPAKKVVLEEAVVEEPKAEPDEIELEKVEEVELEDEAETEATV